MPTIYNKVVIDGSTLMDISDTTAVAADVASGKYFYTANGTKTLGTASGSSSEGQTATGTVTGSGTTVLEIPCSFEPDVIYVYGDMSDDVSNRGVVSLAIIKDTAIYITSDGSQSSAQENGYVIHGITGYNESNTSEAHATYTNNVLTVDTVENTSSMRFMSGLSYTYELSTLGTGGGGGSSATLITKTIAANGTYLANDDNADGYSSVTVNVPSSGITPTGSINITTNGTHDVTNYASAVVNVPTSSGGGSSATQHTIGLTLWDDTTATIPVYYDDSLLNTIITSFKPTMYNNKQIAQASLDNVIWFNPVRIPLNIQLIDFTKIKEHYGIDDTGEEEEYEWSSATDYIRIDPNMTFNIINYRWFGLYFYDTNKTYIDAMQAQSLPNATIDENDNAHGTLTALAMPSNAEYLRLVIGLGADDTAASVIRIG